MVTEAAPLRFAERAASIAVLPPPTTITSPDRCGCSPRLTSLRNRVAGMTPRSSSPGTPRRRLLEAPVARKIALKPSRSRSGRPKSRPIAVSSRSSTPESEDPLDLLLEDLARQAVLRDADGHHAAGHGHRLEDGDRVAEAGEVLGGRHAGGAAADDRDLLGPRLAGAGTAGSLPFSTAKRLSVRMAMGSSRTPRRQADSHGAVQIQPQTDGNGLTSAATA